MPARASASTTSFSLPASTIFFAVLTALLGCEPSEPAPDAALSRGDDAPAIPRCPDDAADATIHIDAVSDRGTLPSLQGFLNGDDPAPGSTGTLDHDTVAALAPRFWRLGTGLGVVLPRVRDFGATITFVVSDGYADLRGGYASARPWEDWTGYDAYVDELAHANVEAGRPITYFDVWGEPQGGTPWLGSYDDLLLLYEHTITRIRAIDPDARFVGPSYDDFAGNVQGHDLPGFVVDLDHVHGLRLEGLSWHELGAHPPEELSARVASLRTSLASRLPGYAPELHVNEYSGPADHLYPGAAVVWLHALHEAGIDVASRACWDVPGEGWSDCWAGLDGLLRPDGRTPQHTYHSHRMYADLVGHRWLATTPSDPRVLALAVARDDGVLVLSGRAGGALGGRVITVRFELEGLTVREGEAIVEIRRVPIDAIPGPLPATRDERCTALVTDGALAITVDGYDDGAALGLRIGP